MELHNVIDVVCECRQRNGCDLGVVGRSSTGSATSWLWTTWTAWRSDNTRAQDLINAGFNLFTLPPLLPFTWANPARMSELFCPPANAYRRQEWT